MKTSVLKGFGFALVVALAGCGGADRPSDMGHWEAKEGSNFVGNDDAAPERLDAEDVKGRVTPVGFNWSGVRHDLAINPNQPRVATCSCLSVEVGQPTESKFVWRGARPEIQSTNLAVAISALGIDCPGGAANPGDRRPSISGVSRENGNVIIDVEEIASDRPMATGAIIEPPDAGGKIFVRPRNKKLPYAKPNNGNLCRVM
jgi:hypothetical protein